AARLLRHPRGGNRRSYAGLSWQSLQLRLAAAAGNRREYPHAAVIAEGTVASGDRRSPGGSGRARCTHHHFARRRLLWRQTRLVVRPRARPGDRPRPCHLSPAARPGARMGLSSRSRFAALHETLPPFASFGFPGHAVTGREFTSAIAAATHSKLQVDRMTWWLIHALRPIVPLCRELSEIAYLWNEPHRIEGGKLKAA